jgi:hypothetical protein
MLSWHIVKCLGLICAIACLAFCGVAKAAEHHGQVTFGGLPVPGATITITQGDKKFVAITDAQGFYSFADAPEGKWTIEIEMAGFATIQEDLVIGPNMPAAVWELKMLPLDQIKAEIKPVVASPNVMPAPSKNEPAKSAQTKPQPNQAQATQPPPEDAAPASDGFLINGSQNNGAASPFAQLATFGNNRNGGNSLYNGSIGLILDNAALDARPFSLSGDNTPKAAYNQITGVATFGGPLNIPHVFRNGPFVFAGYQWTRSRNATTDSALVPSLAERNGDFSQTLNSSGQPVQIFDPSTGLPFPGNMILPDQINKQAQALLNLYPLPNITGNPRYNYQIPIVSNTHQDALQLRFNKFVNFKNQVYGDFAYQSVRADSPNLFGFDDTRDVLGFNGGVHWSHRFSQRVILSLGYRFSRLSTRITPYWENRENVSGDAGITGNDQDPMNWGPPSLTFSSGIAGLSDSQSSFDRNQTSALSYSLFWSRDHHNFTVGGDFRRQQFNYLSQQDPRGEFTFTGAATQGTPNNVPNGGSDFADFLLGIPDTSAIAFGNADKYFRESVYDAFVTDDWRMTPQLTLSLGIRWEYGAPITELDGRLVNLDITPGFGAAAPVVASDPVGPLTSQSYPSSLVRPDKHDMAPRLGIAWRPISGSSMVVRAGYGIYYDSSVYQTIALQMAQEAPLSKSLSVQNSPACPLTLANGFVNCAATTPDTFAIDPNFRIGYAQNWQLAVQRDLPGSLQLTVTYLGIKGTRGVQEFLPNTYPVGAANPCPSCPLGFEYLTSNGNSTREAGQVQLRRRLHNGFTATLQYTYSKSIDDDSAMGGQGATALAQDTPQNAFNPSAATGGGATQGSPNAPTVAQNWLNLNAERGLSAFDQRHLLSTQLQYTTGMGIGGETLLSGWRGVLLKEWTFVTQIIVGSGLPETPIYLAAVPGTGITGSIRPDYTGAPIGAAPSGLFLNPAAYSAPLPGQWGTAGRDSIIGPAEFTLNGSLARTFRLHGRYNLDVRMDATNLLNHVTFPSWDTIVNNTQFGEPTTANPMRSMQATMRLRF